MQLDRSVAQARQLPPWVVLAALLGATSALAGGYWDDAWHTERGRDAFLIAPHVAIYAGIAAVGGALGLWLALLARAGGAGAIRRNPRLVLAAISVGATLASGPIDNAWHAAFGRDAVIWSPPHMLGIVGTLGLGAALLGEVGRRRVLGPVVGGLALAAATFAVVEYDTDVPQFDALWYLPVLGLGSAVALGLVRLTSSRRWAATSAAAAHLVFLLAVGGFLIAVGFEPPQLPLVLGPAVLLDLGARRGWSQHKQAGIFVLALYGLYVPVRNLLGDGVEIEPLDVLLGAPLAFLGVAVILALVDGGPPRRAGAAAAAIAIALALGPVVPAGALAHDPGQGEDAGTMRLEARGDGRLVTLRGRYGEQCAAVRGALVARRSGRELRAPLRLTGCSFSGRVTLPERGRWFLYAELSGEWGAVESWLPLSVGEGQSRAAAARRYAYSPPQRESSAAKYAGGGLLYAAMAALIVAMFRLLRDTARPSPT